MTNQTSETKPKEEVAPKEEILRIEVNFPVKVAFPDKYFQRLAELVGEVCDEWQKSHPGRVMWPAGMGYKITHMPMTRQDEQERGIEFAEDTIEISCFERADYKAKCAKCGHEQGDHKDHILDPPAGDCDFTISNG